jgi:hypothetical protein
MARPQSPELRRSGTTPVFEPDNIASRLEARKQPGSSGSAGPVPEENQPGHHPERDQDKPDMDAFVARFNGQDEDETDGESGERLSGTTTADMPGGDLRARRSRSAVAVGASCRMAGSAAVTAARAVTLPARLASSGAKLVLDRVRGRRERS